ncbi:hypothetical protein [Bacillus multifaciens]|nr:hypothetical protein [Bacillus sp. WLY-B-L8]MDP7981383.1 hypothetical protein [Bacillus sp. WLY-B-L8]
MKFDLRGDEIKIIEAIKEYVPIEREDIWSWLCDLESEIKES